MSLEGQLRSALQRYRHEVDIHQYARNLYKKKVMRKLTSAPAFVGAFAFGFIATVRSSKRNQSSHQHNLPPLSRWQRFKNLRRSVLRTYGTWLAIRTTLEAHLNTSVRSNNV